MSTTDESPSTDFERIVLSQGAPLSAFSMGTVMKLSTSSVERPGASVWISTSGGANSGNTSKAARCVVLTPTKVSNNASTTTTTRSRSEVAMSQDIIGKTRRSKVEA